MLGGGTVSLPESIPWNALQEAYRASESTLSPRPIVGYGFGVSPRCRAGIAEPISARHCRVMVVLDMRHG